MWLLAIVLNSADWNFSIIAESSSRQHCTGQNQGKPNKFPFVCWFWFWLLVIILTYFFYRGRDYNRQENQCENRVFVLVSPCYDIKQLADLYIHYSSGSGTEQIPCRLAKPCFLGCVAKKSLAYRLLRRGKDLNMESKDKVSLPLMYL